MYVICWFALPAAVQDSPGSAGTGSPHALGPNDKLQGGTPSSPPSGAAHTGLCVHRSLPGPLESAHSSSAELIRTTLVRAINAGTYSCVRTGTTGKTSGELCLSVLTFRDSIRWDLEDSVQDFDLSYSVLWSWDAIGLAQLI